MARIVLIHDADPTFWVEVKICDPAVSDYDAACPRCPWGLVSSGTRVRGVEDAVEAVIVHLDHQHDELTDPACDPRCHGLTMGHVPDCPTETRHLSEEG